MAFHCLQRRPRQSRRVMFLGHRRNPCPPHSCPSQSDVVGSRDAPSPSRGPILWRWSVERRGGNARRERVPHGENGGTSTRLERISCPSDDSVPAPRDATVLPSCQASGWASGCPLAHWWTCRGTLSSVGQFPSTCPTLLQEKPPRCCLLWRDSLSPDDSLPQTGSPLPSVLSVSRLSVSQET